jgi:hypothetical protein
MTTGRIAEDPRFIAEWEKVLRAIGSSLEDRARREQIGAPAE